MNQSCRTPSPVVRDVLSASDMLTDEMAQTIGTMHWEVTHFVAHGDTSLMPTDRALWAGAFSSPTVHIEISELMIMMQGGTIGFHQKYQPPSKEQQSPYEMSPTSFLRTYDYLTPWLDLQMTKAVPHILSNSSPRTQLSLPACLR